MCLCFEELRDRGNIVLGEGGRQWGGLISVHAVRLALPNTRSEQDGSAVAEVPVSLRTASRFYHDRSGSDIRPESVAREIVAGGAEAHLCSHSAPDEKEEAPSSRAARPHSSERRRGVATQAAL